MPVIEQAVWTQTIYLLEESDPVQGGQDGVDNRPHKDLANRTLYLKGKCEEVQGEVQAARGTHANLGARLAALASQTLQGENTMSSTSGRTVAHNVGHTSYVVNLTMLADTEGDLGDVYVTKAANAFTVYNTGGFLGAFRYQIMT